MLGIILSMMIHARYPGGAEAFNEDYSVFITEDNVILAPVRDGVTLPKEFKDGLEEMASGMNFKPIYAALCNFQGRSQESAQEYSENVMKERLLKYPDIMVQVNYSLLDITANEITMDSDDGRALICDVLDLEQISNFRIKFKDDVYFHVPLEGESIARKTKIETGIPGREKPINKDDIVDLQIALGSCESVEDFLAML